VAETGGIQVRTVLRGGAAEHAGFAPGDEWLAIECTEGAAAPSAWRIQRLDDISIYAPPGALVTALVARDRRLLRLPLRLPRGVTTWRLTVRDAGLAAPWLQG
jgi:predicted metalloprotease with PDZ domain